MMLARVGARRRSHRDEAGDRGGRGRGGSQLSAPSFCDAVAGSMGSCGSLD
jgi:hypothetical protein